MTPRTTNNYLTERSREVLRHIVREFVRTGRPVGSKTISGVCLEGLSSATIRNVMSDLEELGLVKQPHTSAGRAPTTAGYRLYIDDIAAPPRLPKGQVRSIKESLAEDSDADHVMSRTSAVLSRYSGVVGFVIGPRVDSTVMKDIKFVGMSDNRILVILVDHAGLVRHRVIHHAERLTQKELDQAGRFLARNFGGVSLGQVRARLVALMRKEETLYDQLLQTVILLGSASLDVEPESTETEPAVYLGGTAGILRDVSPDDLRGLRALFRAIEEKRLLVRILDDCVADETDRPTVKIGLDRQIPGLEEFSLITSSYAYDEEVSGRLGIVGPRRMEYERAISLVSCVATLVSEVFAGNAARN